VEAEFQKFFSKIIAFWEVMPCSLVNITNVLEETTGSIGGRRGRVTSVLYLEHGDAAGLSETTANIYHATRRHVPGESNLHRHRSENPKSPHKNLSCFSSHFTNNIAAFRTVAKQQILNKATIELQQ
jgi:hypothetical protein